MKDNRLNSTLTEDYRAKLSSYMMKEVLLYSIIFTYVLAGLAAAMSVGAIAVDDKRRA
ncbi:hypothetical protein ACERJO_14315 [Halalkalibacter sp. AB-rgal2]|uniref:hypothetical protein n=1 Tax=Halalkalibacter sp. AB-rgal2 TaxID=3242695 RepID=UPI00359D3EF7